MDALEQAICEREVTEDLVHQRDRGVQYQSIRCYTDRLAEAGIASSVASVGDSCDNALVETIRRLYKTELIRKQGPRNNVAGVELATLKWDDWYNNRQLYETLGNIPPSEYEEMYYQGSEVPTMVMGLN